MLIAAALLAACGRGDAARDGSGRPAARVNVYNWADFIGRTTLPDFERTTGIKVNYDTFDSEETALSKLLLGDSGYDVVVQSSQYFSRGIKAGLYEPLDRRRLPHWRNLGLHNLAVIAPADPGNRYGVPFLHAIAGFTYNLDMVRARMPDAPLDSLDMLFRPEVIRRFADCGVSFFESAEDVLPLALNYLHRPPYSTDPADYAAAEKLLMAVRPYVRAFDSSAYTQELLNGELCIAMNWSSDHRMIRDRARAAGVDLHLGFTVPREGTNRNYTALLIPVGAPHPDGAYRFIDYLLQPQVIASITNEIYYGNDNAAADAFVSRSLLEDPTLYPTPEVERRLWLQQEVSPATERIRTRIWTHIRTGL